MNTNYLSWFKEKVNKEVTSAITVVLFFLLCSLSMHSSANKWAEFNDIELPSTVPKTTFEVIETVDSNKYQLFDLHMNLSNVISKIKSSQVAPNIIVLVADTIEVPSNFIMNLENQTVYIYARKIAGEGAAAFLVNASQGATGGVFAYADEITTNLTVGALFPNSNVEFSNITPFGTSEGSFLAASIGVNTLVKSTASLEGLMDISPALLEAIFSKTFDLSASIFDQNPDLSRAMLNSIETSLRSIPTFREDDILLDNLYLQTANLKQFFDFSTLSPSYVPELDANLYEDVYVAYLNAMESYQTQYDRFVDRSIDIEARKDAAVLMQANLMDAVSAEEATIGRSLQQVEHFKDTIENLRVQFRDQNFLVSSARVQFEIGIDRYKREQEIALQLGVLETIVGGAVALGSSAATGNPAGLIDFATTIPDTTQNLQGIKEKIAGVGDILKRVQAMVNEVSDLSSSVNESVNTQDIASSLSSLNLVVPSLEAANDTWELFLNEVRQGLQPAIDEGIDGAAPFLSTLETLIIYGQSVTATEVNLTQELSRLIDLKIAAEVNSRHLDRMNDLVGQIETDEASVEELEVLHFRTLTALKRPIFVAVAKLAAAFEYWALQESQIKPALNKTYEQYRLDLALLQEQYNAALLAFQPRPQDFNLTNVVLSNNVHLDDFRADGEMSFSIDLLDPHFIHFDRVRLSQVRVILQGAELPEDTNYFIDIESNGVYQDRFASTDFTFNSEQLFRFFGYRDLNSSSDDYEVIVEGAVADVFKFAYFEPTPFTTWSIRLREAEDFDLSKVESIRLEFKGTAIPII